MTDRNGIALASLLVLLGGFVSATTTEACTKAQETQVLTVAESVLTDGQKACVVLEVADAIYPPSVPVVSLACGIDAALASAVQSYLPVATQAANALAARRMAAFRKAHPQ
jgi:hypothetical protein